MYNIKKGKQMKEQETEQEFPPGTTIKEVSQNTFVSFGTALLRAQEGKKIKRDIWASEGKWVTLNKPNQFISIPMLVINSIKGDKIPYTPSYEDLLAKDWTAR